MSSSIVRQLVETRDRRVTVYSVNNSLYQPYMSHREINLEMQIDPSKFPGPSNVFSYFT